MHWEISKRGHKVLHKEGKAKISLVHFRQHHVKSLISEEGNLGSLKKHSTEEDFGGKKLKESSYKSFHSSHY